VELDPFRALLVGFTDPSCATPIADLSVNVRQCSVAPADDGAFEVACLDGETISIRPHDTQHSQEWIRIIDEVPKPYALNPKFYALNPTLCTRNPVP